MVLLPRLHLLLTKQLMAIIEDGVILEDKDGNVVIGLDGQPLRRTPSAPELNVIRQFLKDNGIDEEPKEEAPTEELHKKLRQYDDEPLVIAERDELIEGIRAPGQRDNLPVKSES